MTQAMNILFLTSIYPPHTKGGGEQSTHLIAKALLRRGHAVHVVTSGSVDRKYSVEDVPVRSLPLPLATKPLFERRHSKHLARLFLNNMDDPTQYDIVHAHDFRTAMMVSELNLPSAVVTARDYAQICGCTNNILRNGSVNPGCTRWNELFACHRVAEAPLIRKPLRIAQYACNRNYRFASFRSFKYMIFISHSQQQEIAMRQNLEGITTSVIYNPVIENYEHSGLTLPEDRNIVYVGRVEMYKGVHVLLKAFRMIAGRFHDSTLTIVGDGAQRTAYEQEVRKWNLQTRIVFTGYRDQGELRSLYQRSLIAVAPHIWIEPFGRSVVDAMAIGSIVITSNVGGPAEIVRDGYTGFLVNRGSVNDLATAIARVLGMSKESLRKIQLAARDRVANTVSPGIIAHQHELFYEKILKSAKRSIV